MSLREIETAMLAELREVADKRSIRLKDIMEWSTAPVQAQEGETLYFLPNLKIHVAVKLPAKGQ